MKWRRQAGISRPVFASLSNCSERTLATQEAKRRLALRENRNLTETRRLILALSEIMDPTQIGPWLNAKNEWFDGKTPLQIIQAGRIDQVWEMIYHTREGGYA